MRLSPAAELAVRGVLVLAEKYGQGPVPLNDICAKRDLPKQYLTKIFATLARADVVSPLRGKHGGYTLARAPKDISLLEVVEAVEGPIVLNYCQSVPPKCDEDDCLIRPVWCELQRVVRAKLASMRLSDCIRGKIPTARDTAPV